MGMTEKGKIFLISLGCAKNLVDSENMLGILSSTGFRPVSSTEEAEIVLVNTCGFIQAAVEETIDTILELINLKKKGGLKKVFVAGCFVQRYGYKLLREIPEVDGWLGTGEIHRVADLLSNHHPKAPPPFLIGRPSYLADHTVPRMHAGPVHTAYLKIAEGCSHRCSFCTIPTLRGPFRSRSLDSLIAEARHMADLGVKEINLIAQDTTQYGKDLQEGACLEDLLERLVQLNGIRWIRLLYCHPNGISRRLLDLMDSEDAICPYLDVPFQHVNEKILLSMGRDFQEKHLMRLIERVKSSARNIRLRTTLMVGFPGETQAIFDQLCNFVRTAEFDHLGVFTFSKEKGTAAARFPQTVTSKEAERRRDRIMAIQGEIAERKNQEMVGQTVSVLLEGTSPETHLLLQGRTSTMAPDVDSRVLINKGKGIPGDIMPVLIKEAYPYDLLGEIRTDIRE